MTDINRINPGLNVRVNKINTQKETDKVSKEAESTQVPPKTNFKSADEVLNFLGNASVSADTVQKKKIQVSKYVSPEQKERIEANVRKCIEKLFEIEDVVIKELGISQPMAQAVAVQTFETNYMPS